MIETNARVTHRNNDFRHVADLARINAADRPEKAAFRFEGRELTYAALEAQSNRAALAAISEGVQPGDRIAYLGKNSDVYFELMIAVAKVGAVLTPLNWRLAPPEIAWILDDCGARVLFVGPEFVTLADRLCDEVSALTRIIATEAIDGGPSEYARWRDTSVPGSLPACTEHDPVLQMYTSGTTGKPKGAVLTSASILRTALDHDPALLDPWDRWQDGDVSLVAMPCFHVGGTLYGVMTMRNGATGMIMREFDPAKVLDHIEHDGISKIFLVPAAMQFIVAQPKARSVDFSRLRYIAYGASPIPLPLLRTAIDVFGCGFVQMYGMTETSGTIAQLPPHDHDPAGNPRMRSIGKPMRGVEMKVIDDAGEPVADATIGEIAIRTQANMREYWQRPDATAETIDAEGWLRTGDAGYRDADGYFYLHDRIKDMIISGGENIYPAEVEAAVCEHQGVAEVAVIGVPDVKWGEAVKACVVLKPGASGSADDIIAFARTRIAGYKVPKSIDFIDALPRNSSGKVLRRELRAPYWAGQDRQVS